MISICLPFSIVGFLVFLPISWYTLLANVYICWIYLSFLFDSLKKLLNCVKFVFKIGGCSCRRLLIDFFCRSVVNFWENICVKFGKSKGGYWCWFHWWVCGIDFPMLQLIGIPMCLCVCVCVCVCNLASGMCSMTKLFSGGIPSYVSAY